MQTLARGATAGLERQTGMLCGARVRRWEAGWGAEGSTCCSGWKRVLRWRSCTQSVSLASIKKSGWRLSGPRRPSGCSGAKPAGVGTKPALHKRLERGGRGSESGVRDWSNVCVRDWSVMCAGVLMGAGRLAVCRGHGQRGEEGSGCPSSRWSVLVERTTSSKKGLGGSSLDPTPCR